MKMNTPPLIVTEILTLRLAVATMVLWVMNLTVVVGQESVIQLKQEEVEVLKKVKSSHFSTGMVENQ